MQQLKSVQETFASLGKVKNFDEKKVLLEKVVQQCDEALGQEGTPNKYMIYFYKGQACFQQGNLEEANESFNQALAIKPDYTQIFGPKGQVLQQLGKYGEAIIMYEKLIEKNQADAAIFILKANAHQRLNQYQEVIQSLEKVIEKNQADQNTYNLKATAHQKLNQLKEALECYEKAGESFLINFNKAIINEEFQKYDEALQAYDKALKYPDGLRDSKILRNKSLILIKQDKIDEAQKSILFGLKIEFNNDELLEIQAHIYFLQKKYDEALQMFNQLLQKIKSQTQSTEKGKILQKLKYFNQTPEECCQKIGESFQASLYRAYILEDQDKLQEALEMYEKVQGLQENKLDIRAIRNKAAIQFKLQKYEESQKSCEEGLKIDANNVDLLEILAQIYYINNKFEESLQTFEKVLKTRPYNVNAINYKGTLLVKLNLPYSAVEFIEKNNETFMNCLNKAIALDDLGRFEESLQNYEKALKYPEGINFIQIYKNKLLIEEKLLKPQTALLSCINGLKISPNDLELLEKLCQIQMDLKQYDDALVSVEKLVKLNPNKSTELKKGIILLKKQEMIAAKQIFDNYIRQVPNDYIGYLNLGLIFYEQKKYSEALEKFKIAITKNNSQNATCFLYQGMAYFQSGQLDNALQSFDQAINLNRYYIEAYNQKVQVLETQNKYQEVIDCYDQILKIEKDDFYLHNNKGTVHVKMNQINEALKEFNKCIQINEKFILGWANRVQLYYNQGKLKEANDDLKILKTLILDKKNLENLKNQDVEFIQKINNLKIEIDHE